LEIKYRVKAAEELGRIGSKEAVDGLLSYFDLKIGRTHHYVDIAVIRALEKIGDKRALPKLIDLCLRGYPVWGSLRSHLSQKVDPCPHALDAVVKICNGRVDEAIVAGLKHKDENVRSAMIYVLQEIGDADAVKLLKAASKDESWRVRQAVKEALTEIRIRTGK
jgi:HEAT repeat protein